MRSLKSITLSLLSVTILIGLTKWYFSAEESGLQKTVTKILDPSPLKEDHDHHHDHSSVMVEQKKNLNTDVDSNEETDTASKVELVNREEVQEILAMAQDYPHSKSALINHILEKDPYEELGQEVKPHSLDEIKQRQKGALKIIALRVIVENEKDKATLLRDLKDLKSRLTDPTLKAITQAVHDSASKGRPFFEDFPKAVSRLGF